MIFHSYEFLSNTIYIVIKVNENDIIYNDYWGKKGNTNFVRDKTVQLQARVMDLRDKFTSLYA